MHFEMHPLACQRNALFLLPLLRKCLQRDNGRHATTVPSSYSTAGAAAVDGDALQNESPPLRSIQSDGFAT